MLLKFNLACSLAFLCAAPVCAQAQAQAQEFVPILMYHQVTDTKESGPYVVSEARFAEHTQALKNAGYKTVSLQAMSVRSFKPFKSVVITFDDGWASVKAATRILKDQAMTGTLFLTSGLLNTPGYLTVTEAQSLQAQGMEIGAHSHTHYTKVERGHEMAEEELVGEMLKSKLLLEPHFGIITHYAWPYGIHTQFAVNAASALGMNSMTVNRESQVFKHSNKMPRITIDGRCTGQQVVDAVKTGKECRL